MGCKKWIPEGIGLQITYTNSKQDYREAYVNHRGIPFRVFAVLVIGFMGGVLLWGFLDLWRTGRPPVGLQLFVLLTWFVFVYFLLLPAPGFARFLCWILRKPYLRYSPTTLDLGEESLEFSCADFHRGFAWGEFQKPKETRNLILLGHKKSHGGLLIPKRALATIELEQLRALLERKIPTE
ncbi:MAG TPA: YcxB family protein [Terriglobales bacterium]|nr:YcxB family protein [Terriglobales bacterium]